MKFNLLFVMLFIVTLAFNSEIPAQNKRAKAIFNPDYNPDGKTGNYFSNGSNTDMINSTWVTLSNSPNAVSRSCCALVRISSQDFVYQFGGGSGSQLKSVARYQVSTNSWNTSFAPMLLDVSSGSAVAFGDTVIYVFGGNQASGSLGAIQKYRVLTNTWTTMMTMPTQVTDAGVVKYHDSLVYIIGGGTGLFGPGYYNTVQIYNMKRNTISTASGYPIQAGMMGAGVYGDTIITAGGWNGLNAISNSYKGVVNSSNPNLISWSVIPNYPLGSVTRMASYSVKQGTYKGVLFCGGAINGSAATNGTYLWSAKCSSWDSTSGFSTPRSNMKAAGKGDSVVYVVAGFNSVGLGNTDKIILFNVACTFIAHDVGCTGIEYPDGLFAIKKDTSIIPKATVKNFGTSNETFNVTMEFNDYFNQGVQYTSTKQVTLAAGASVTISFDKYNTVEGNYNATVVTQLAGDQNPSNDSCIIDLVSILDPNVGFKDGNYFANSIGTYAPSHPQFNWADTAGSIYIIKNQVIIDTPHFQYNLDDGYSRYSYDALDRRIRTFYEDQDSFFIGTNGIISFSSFDPGNGNWYPPANLIPSGNVKNAVYPFWTDFDWSNNTVAYSSLCYKITNEWIIITYNRAPLYGGGATDYSSFQILIELVPLSLTSNSRIVIQYADGSNGMTGQGFIDKVVTNNLTPNLVGLQNSSGIMATSYKYLNANGDRVPRSIFTTTYQNLALEFGPDPSQLNFNGVSSTVYPDLKFAQRNYILSGTVENNSDWGELQLTTLGYPGIRYLNLSAMGPGISDQWQIRNIILSNNSAIGNPQTLTVAFDIGTKGINTSAIQYGYSITEFPLLTPPPVNLTAPVTDEDIKLYTGFNTNGEPIGNPPIPPSVPNVTTTIAKDTSTHSVSDVPNQDCGPSECLPAAISNSLKFLRKEHNLTFDSAYASMDSAKKACGWGQPGTDGDNWPTNKDNYMKKNNLPITTRVIPKDKIKQIIDEIDNKQDVEMVVHWKRNDSLFSHIVNVVAIKKLDSGKYEITTQDDRKQGVAGGQKKETVRYDSTTNKFTSGDFVAYTEGIYNFVVECPNKLQATPVTPANGSGGVSPKAPFTWTTSPGAASYWLEVATDVAFNNLVINQDHIPANSFTPGMNQLQPLTLYYWRVRVNDSAGSGSYTTIFSFTTGSGRVLNLSVLLQGSYDASSNSMTPDTTMVYLRNATSPFALVDSAKGILNSSGSGSFNFYTAVNGVNYYVVVKHRNSIETCSSMPLSFAAGVLNYDFRTGTSKAYGGNMIQVDTSPVRFAVYSGDVNYDHSVDVTDLISIYNSALNFESGYVTNDLNNDGIVDVADMLIAYNNLINIVSAVLPY